jgi:hypothetical protein
MFSHLIVQSLATVLVIWGRDSLAMTQVAGRRLSANWHRRGLSR